MADIIVNDERLKKFCTQVFVKLGVPEKDAEITSDVLVMSDSLAWSRSADEICQRD